MTMQFVVCSIASALAFVAAAPALAAPECLANGKSFQIGQVTCLTPAGQSHLARCEMVLNNTSWTKLQDDCPGNIPASKPSGPASSAPAPSMVPTEPTEN